MWFEVALQPRACPEGQTRDPRGGALAAPNPSLGTACRSEQLRGGEETLPAKANLSLAPPTMQGESCRAKLATPSDAAPQKYKSGFTG